jgi:hypothetical protein
VAAAVHGDHVVVAHDLDLAHVFVVEQGAERTELQQLAPHIAESASTSTSAASSPAARSFIAAARRDGVDRRWRVSLVAGARRSAGARARAAQARGSTTVERA